jgi:hypothetical protein
MRAFWISASLLLVFSGFAHAQTGSMLDPRTDRDGAVLSLILDWRAAGQSYGLLPKIILRPEGLIVSTTRVGVQAQDFSNGCASRLRAGHVPGTPPTVEEMQGVLDCDRGTVHADVAPQSNRQGVILPWGAGQRRCSDATLTHGQYRLCATVLQQSQNSFQMEYEEASHTSGTLLVTRARFEVTLERYPATSLLAGRITGCSVQTSSAYSFNPRNPGKMTPMETLRGATCSRVAV